MHPNPYVTPQAEPGLSESPRPRVRRLDIAAIAIGNVALVIAYVVAIYSPPIREWFMPRFGGGAGLTLFPLAFLCLYLWKPASSLLSQASLMFIVAAVLNAAAIARGGTVRVVSNSHTDLLASAYLWSVLSYAVVGMHVGYVAWRTRH